jgi:hypothetical protein
VKRIASTFFTFSRNIWQRKSGVVSTTIVVDTDSIIMLGRKRLSFVSFDVHTSHSQAIIGTPVLVPVPRNVILREG